MHEQASVQRSSWHHSSYVTQANPVAPDSTQAPSPHRRRFEELLFPVCLHACSMSAELPATGQNGDLATPSIAASEITEVAPAAAAPDTNNNHDVASEDAPRDDKTSASAVANNEQAADDDEEDEEEEEEPKLKYAKLTGSLANVYRNGDSTSTFLAAGDKMVIGTHSGSIHVLGIPALQSIRTYRAHQASVTSVSVSPTPPPPTLVRSEGGGLAVLQTGTGNQGKSATPSNKGSTVNPRTGRPQQQPVVVPNTPSNNIYIATSSLDGRVCVQSLVNTEDVQLRNFARPVNAVALSPDYKNDRTYLSGGLAGNLILTVGGKSGVSTDANTNSAAAAASGWLGAIGLGSNTGRDTILHSGEGAINSIKWSLSGKWVAWINEEGIKVMRSHLKLGSEESEDAWRRIAHAQKPNKKVWEEMAGVWKGRCEWINDQNLESDDVIPALKDGGSTTKSKKMPQVEKLVVGWGDTAWLLHVHSSTSTTSTGKRQVGSADIIHKLHFVDCVISGISFYTPSLLAILAYRTRDDNDKPIATPAGNGEGGKTERRGRQHRHTGLAPQLRLVNVVNGEEVDLDELSNISRYETLSSQDYHLGAVYIPLPAPASDKIGKESLQKGALEGIWDAASGVYVSRIFSSAASIRSNGSGGNSGGRAASFISGRPGSGRDVTATPEVKRKQIDAHPYALEAGLKFFIVSPYDCVLAVKRELADHLKWLLEHQEYANAWSLVDKHPEIVENSSSANDSQSSASVPGSPTKSLGPGQQGGSLADFFADDRSSQVGGPNGTYSRSKVESEKHRIGQLWLAQLIANDNWVEAGKIAGKVLGNSNRWEHWVLTFAQADKFDEITPYIPAMKDDSRPLPSSVYEVILGHYIYADRKRLAQLLDQWDPELFDVKSVILAIEDRLASEEVKEDSEDWRILLESLARLYLADGRARDALRCYIRLQDAEKAFTLIREEKLLDTVVEDIPGLLTLRVSREQMRSASLAELDEASAEAVQLLAEEAHRRTVPTATVVNQLQRRGDSFQPFLFFYLRALWNGVRENGRGGILRGRRFLGPAVEEGHVLVNEFGDLAVSLFAEYDRNLLLAYLQHGEGYKYERAIDIFERRHYIPELVLMYSKTGQTKRALELIIGELGDVKQAIAFVKEHSDLWGDLLDYSMNKPRFIRGLLEEVGAVSLDDSFNPIDVVRRIPDGLEIEGLKNALWKFVREFEIQLSISEGVARVLRGEVAAGMDTLRAGRKKAVAFEVLHDTPQEVEVTAHDVPIPGTDSGAPEATLPTPTPASKKESSAAAARLSAHPPPGHCVGCAALFHEDEKETLLGFACGHVYHLSCLLAAHPDTRDSAEGRELLRQLESSRTEDADDGLGGRSVGAKVAHAHIIQNVLGATGCAVCKDLGPVGA